MTNFQTIVEFLGQVNSYKYAFLDIEGNLLDESSNDFLERYVLHTPEDFENFEAGTCWDFTSYEACWFNEHNIEFKTFYIAVTKKDEFDYSHTFLVFHYQSYWYYFESSWKNLQGIYKSNKISYILGFVMNQHLKANNLCKKEIDSIYCFEYDALDKHIFGMNAEEFPVYVIDRYDLVEIPNIFKTPIKII